ncbi:MAG: hypothetical protein A3C13_01560 [Candidatus Lloydbacteria bacterium RIFCSPHIGHO2_02_FULL_50_11]|nr:MAG: hypothetical protein A3C13_01560 [Candidatus Lloydbacteria bacterium RIFCSPHIGHO2_02_FULL_50_11]
MSNDNAWERHAKLTASIGKMLLDGTRSVEDLNNIHQKFVSDARWKPPAAASTEELPKCGVIKDLDVLYRVVNKFAGGFIETSIPNGVCRWGRLNGGNIGSWTSCDAVRGKNEEWKYAPSNKDGWSLNLIGVRHLSKDRVYWDELIGDAFLCSDGTVFHSYYFSRKEWSELQTTPDDWKDGYYHNRLYPPGSSMIPKHITDSFEREMPAWFYKNDEAFKAKTQKSA